MQVFAGTSGFSFDEWQGRFYPRGLSPDDRLAYYASRLHTVEINNTFYQMPKPAVLARWSQAVPDGFRFALKAPRRITHSQRLKPEGDTLDHFLSVAAALNPKLGTVLFQLPPFLRKDETLLAEFLSRLPASLRASFEFRHPSWFVERIFALLADKNAALCAGDADERGNSPPFIATADFGYMRLRAAGYDAATLREWSRRVAAERWSNAYIYLKHEVLGPDYAQFIAAVASNQPEPALPSELGTLLSPSARALDPTRTAKGPARALDPARTAKGPARAVPRVADNAAVSTPKRRGRKAS